MLKSSSLALLGVILTAAAQARPDDTPWGRAPGEVCDACHFDRTPVEASPALSLVGGVVESGSPITLALTMSEPAMKRAGMRMIAVPLAGNPVDAGTFLALDEKLEADGDRVRSTLIGTDLSGDGQTRWLFAWQPPEPWLKDIGLIVEAVAANDDDSPLGDTVHRRCHILAAGAAAPTEAPCPR